MRISDFRRRVALWLYPELLAAQGVVQAPDPEISGRTEHVIRLGRLFLAMHEAPSFVAALGFGRRRSIPMRHPDYVEIDPLHRLAGRMWSRWNALVNCPPKRIGDDTYDRFTCFFSAHWPEGHDWPSDIPRPQKSKETAQ